MTSRRALLTLLMLVGCGPSSTAPPAPADTTRTPPPVAPSASPGASAAAPASAALGATQPAETQPVTEPPGEAMDLLRAVPAAVAVSSTYRDDPVQAARLVDGDRETAWNSRTGDLVGAWIEVGLPEDAQVTSIDLTAGFTHRTATADLFDGNHRVSRVRVTVPDGRSIDHDLDPSSRDLQSIPVGGPGGRYRVEVLAVVPGARPDWRELCVSELRVMGRAPGAQPGTRAPVTAVGSLPALPPATSITTTGPTTSSVPAATTVPAAPTVPAATSAPARDGVYFVGERGVVRLDARGARTIAGYAMGLHRAPDGVVYAYGAHEGRPFVRRVEGDSLGRSLGPEEPFPSPQALAGTAGGDLWLAGTAFVAHYEAARAAWQVVPAEGNGDFRAVLVDRSGQVWLAARAGLARWTGERFALEPGSPRGASGLVDGPRGLVATTFDGTLERSGETWRPLAEVLHTEGPLGSPALRADGTMAARQGPGERIVIAAPDGTARVIEPAALGAPRGSISALTWDAQGRLWILSDAGVAVLEPDLSTISRIFAAGTIPDVRPPVWQMLAVGDLAELPPSRGGRGHVHGTVVADGRPLARVRVELCAEPWRGSLGSGWASPCEGDERGIVAGGTTREDGTFDFYGVPPGQYVLVAARADRRWYFAPSRSYGRGASDDLGTIDTTSR